MRLLIRIADVGNTWKLRGGIACKYSQGACALKPCPCNRSRDNSPFLERAISRWLNVQPVETVFTVRAGRALLVAQVYQPVGHDSAVYTSSLMSSFKSFM